MSYLICIESVLAFLFVSVSFLFDLYFYISTDKQDTQAGNTQHTSSEQAAHKQAPDSSLVVSRETTGRQPKAHREQ